MTHKTSPPTAGELRLALNYDPSTGVLTWNADRGKNRITGRRAGYLNHSYRRIRVNGLKMLEHRVIWCLVTGDWPKHEIDHINGVKSDNRLCNLREATRAENTRNKCLPRNNTSGFKGVCWSKQAGKWFAQIGFEGRTINLGHFDRKDDAATAYREASRRLHGEFGRAA